MGTKSVKKMVKKDVVGDDFGGYVAEVEAGLSPARREMLSAFRADYILASQLIQMRKDRKLTQVELADRAGVDQSARSRIERGAVNASYASLRRIGRVLGMRVAFIPVDRVPASKAGTARAARAIRA